MTHRPDPDQTEAATADAARQVRGMAAALPEATITERDRLSDAVMDLIAGIVGSPVIPRCEHLRRRPVQPTFFTSWDLQHLCALCVGSVDLTYTGVDACLCDFCDAPVEQDDVTAHVIQAGQFILRMRRCPDCPP